MKVEPRSGFFVVIEEKDCGITKTKSCINLCSEVWNFKGWGEAGDCSCSVGREAQFPCLHSKVFFSVSIPGHCSGIENCLLNWVLIRSWHKLNGLGRYRQKDLVGMKSREWEELGCKRGCMHKACCCEEEENKEWIIGGKREHNTCP